MRKNMKIKGMEISPYVWHIGLMVVACSIFYYLSVIASFSGLASLGNTLGALHELYGIDIFALAFFAPVVYAAYIVGIKGALLTALICMLILLPYAIFVDAYPNALLKPTAFAIILSAVGAVVAYCLCISGVPVHRVEATDWTRGKSKPKRIRSLKLVEPSYTGKGDAGGDEADAICLGRWWIVREKNRKERHG